MSDTKRFATSTLALILASTTPMIVATDTLANTVMSIKVDLIELPDAVTGDYLIGRTEKGYLIALKKADDGTTLNKLAIASSDLDGQFIFAPAELRQGEDGLYFESVPSGGVLMTDDKQPLRIDPRFVATLLVQDNGGEYLGELVAVIEDDELLFGPETNVGQGTLVELTMLTLAKKTFLVAKSEAKGVLLAFEAKKFDKTTWIAQGNIGHLGEDGNIVDISTTGLSAFGIGIPPTSTASRAMPASTGAGHDVEKRVAA